MAAGAVWVLLVLLGQTPLERASGLALAILGITASMRQFGYVASLAGGLTVALSPILWSQAGGAGTSPGIASALIVALLVMALGLLFLRRGFIGVGMAVSVFVLLFWRESGSGQSLRLTGLVTAWLLYLLADMILRSNPRPGIMPAQSPRPWHSLGLLFLFAIGIINDPLISLLAPAILLALFLSHAELGAGYWALAALLFAVGIMLLTRVYLLPQPPLVDIWGWRAAQRWIELGRLMVGQFSVLGIGLAVIGLARLSRWYPPLGIVTMLAYAAYIIFGLVYLGGNREILLLPLTLIQVMWMTYAVNTCGQWLNKTLDNESGLWIHLVSALYFLVPVILLHNILQS